MLCKKPFNGFGCGQCLPCRINRRNKWSFRSILEGGLHGDTGFLTLTYDPDKAPKTRDGLYNLNPVHLEKFWKRFRLKLPPKSLRYLAVGEYGHDGTGFIDASGTQWNPHYHAALFGFGCLGPYLKPETGNRCYCDNCECVRKAWGFGNITIDPLTDDAAAYINGYVLKKMTSPDDFRLAGRNPEFKRQSQGIARGAVDEIVQALLSQYGSLALQDGDVPTALKMGNISKPLDRYLRKKIREGIKLERVNPETGEVDYGAPHESLRKMAEKLEPEMHSLQEAIRNAPQEEKSALYTQLDAARVKSVSKRLQRIKNLETKHKIYQSQKEKKL